MSTMVNSLEIDLGSYYCYALPLNCYFLISVTCLIASSSCGYKKKKKLPQRPRSVMTKLIRCRPLCRRGWNPFKL